MTSGRAWWSCTRDTEATIPNTIGLTRSTLGRGEWNVGRGAWRMWLVASVCERSTPQYSTIFKLFGSLWEERWRLERPLGPGDTLEKPCRLHLGAILSQLAPHPTVSSISSGAFDAAVLWSATSPLLVWRSLRGNARLCALGESLVGPARGCG